MAVPVPAETLRAVAVPGPLALARLLLARLRNGRVVEGASGPVPEPAPAPRCSPSPPEGEWDGEA